MPRVASIDCIVLPASGGEHVKTIHRCVTAIPTQAASTCFRRLFLSVSFARNPSVLLVSCLVFGNSLSSCALPQTGTRFCVCVDLRVVSAKTSFCATVTSIPCPLSRLVCYPLPPFQSQRQMVENRRLEYGSVHPQLRLYLDLCLFDVQGLYYSLSLNPPLLAVVHLP